VTSGTVAAAAAAVAVSVFSRVLCLYHLRVLCQPPAPAPVSHQPTVGQHPSVAPAVRGMLPKIEILICVEL
jgi:hypothetical protein